MLKIIQGDLLKSDCDIIIHQANCMGTFGSGIARQIKQQFPEAYAADLNFEIPVKSKDRLGYYSGVFTNNKYVFNLYSQYAYGRDKTYTDYEAMEIGLNRILTSVNKVNPGLKIGLPYLIGAGLAGGDPDIILGILEHLSEVHQTTLYLYRLNSGR